ncbi:MAG TPA: AMP-binding protein, partial [Nitrososphaeraceae archaeon]|nr:AMP-binding protein [Nitrososphaeraceae archaeon]
MMSDPNFTKLSKAYDETKKVTLEGKKLDKIKAQAAENPEKFWAEQAKNLVWFRQWNNILEWNYPFARWFVGGQLNACVNAVDRHINSDEKNKVAIMWEGENGEHRSFTYYQLYHSVNKFANALKNLGVQKGDRVTIYLPMVPELPIAMLACSRIGAIHSVVFSGFSAQALSDRIYDSKSKIIITADGGFRRGKLLELKRIVDDASSSMPFIENIIV